MFSQPLKGYEKSSFKVYIFCAETVKICAADTFCKCVAASGNISSFLMNVRLLLKDINVRLILKESVPLIFFFVCGCFWKHFNVFNEHGAASEKILKKNAQLVLKAIKRKNVQLLLRIMSTKVIS